MPRRKSTKKLDDINVLIHTGDSVYEYPFMFDAVIQTIRPYISEKYPHFIFVSREAAELAAEHISATIDCTIHYCERNINSEMLTPNAETSSVMDTRISLAEVYDEKIDLLLVFDDAIECDYAVRKAKFNNVRILKLGMYRDAFIDDEY